METENLVNLSDEILLARIQNEDDDALVVLIKKYERLLKTIIPYEIHNVEEEADIYSETVLAIVRRIRRQADDIVSAKQWLKQVARSKCKAFLMNAKKRGLITEVADEHYTSVTEQEAGKHVRQYYLDERVYEIREIVEGLGSIYIEVFELWERGLTEAGSAAVLKISPNTVKSRRNKIRKVVRDYLGVSLTPETRK